jgi:putative membrane protein
VSTVLMFWNGPRAGGWGWLGMSLGMLLFWAVVTTVVVLLARTIGTTKPAAPPAVRPSAPEQILAERFARGEIDEKEFQARLAALREARQPARH